MSSRCLSEDELKNEIVRVMKDLYEKSLVNALAGNVSARERGAREFCITPSGLFKGGLKSEDLIKVDLHGNIITGAHKPSIETKTHAAIYKVRQDINAIVHAHNPWLLGLSMAGAEIRPRITVDAALLIKGVEKVGFKAPGSSALAEEVASAARRGANAIILENHGVIGLGSDLLEAEAIVEIMEALAIMEFTCYAMGKEPKEIPLDEIEAMRKY